MRVKNQRLATMKQRSNGRYNLAFSRNESIPDSFRVKSIQPTTLLGRLGKNAQQVDPHMPAAVLRERQQRVDKTAWVLGAKIAETADDWPFSVS